MKYSLFSLATALLSLAFGGSNLSANEVPAAIDMASVKKWSAPYRGWFYHPEHVIAANPGIEGFGDVKMTDVPAVFQIPGRKGWFMSFIGFDGKGYQSFVAKSEDLVQWKDPRLAMGYGPEGQFDHGGVVLGAYLYDSYDIKAPRALKKKDCIYQPWLVEHDGRFWNLYNAANGHIEQLGLATSKDLLTWKRHEGSPVIPIGGKDSFNSKFSSDGKIFWDGDHWVCFFFGVDTQKGGGARIMLAHSRDLKVSFMRYAALTALDDNTHFDTKGQIALGEEMATLMLKALEKSGKTGQNR